MIIIIISNRRNENVFKVAKVKIIHNLLVVVTLLCGNGFVVYCKSITIIHIYTHRDANKNKKKLKLRLVYKFTVTKSTEEVKCK